MVWDLILAGRRLLDALEAAPEAAVLGPAQTARGGSQGSDLIIVASFRSVNPRVGCFSLLVGSVFLPPFTPTLTPHPGSAVPLTISLQISVLWKQVKDDLKESSAAKLDRAGREETWLGLWNGPAVSLRPGEWGWGERHSFLH